MAAIAHTTSYAGKAGHELPTAMHFGGKPVFVKHKDIPTIDDKVITNEEIFKCLCKSVPSCDIKGIQKIGGLWRLYVENQDKRIKIITNGLNVRNVNIAVYDKNPFLRDENDNSLRLLIRDIPLSAHDSLIIDELERLKYKVLGTVSYQRLRVDERLTDCLTGDRVVHIQQPSTPLPRIMNFGLFKGKIFHYGQLPSTTRPKVVCSRCLSEGHHRSQCSGPVVCRRCNQPGHIQQDCTRDDTLTAPLPTQDPTSKPDTPAIPAAVAATAPHVLASIEKLVASGRQQATIESSHNYPSHHDYQTRAQSKITQFLHGDSRESPHGAAEGVEVNKPDNVSSSSANKFAPLSSNPDSYVSPSRTDASSNVSSCDVDDGSEEEASEISLESPELRTRRVKDDTDTSKKRKQKSTKKPPKKK